MKRYLLIVLLLATLPVWAASGKITTSASSCSVSNVSCLIVNLPEDKGGATLTLSGTWTGTITFEASGDGGTTWTAVNCTPLGSTTAVTSSTSNGTWQVNMAGFTGIRMRASATMTGSAVATITPSAASARTNGGGASLSLSASSPIVVSPNPITGTGTISCPTCATGSGASVTYQGTVPAIATFAWVNQQTGSTVTQNTATGPILMKLINTGGANWSGLFVNQPTPPYSLYVHIRCVGYAVSSQTCGIFFYDGTKLSGMEVLMQSGGPQYLRVEHITNVTTDGSTVAQLTSVYGNAADQDYWWCLGNDGTTLIYNYSPDGTNYINLFSDTIAAGYITPTKIGFGGVNINGSSLLSYTDVLAWSTTTSGTCVN